MAETCDHCGPAVSAKVIVALQSGGLLTFCGHCANDYRIALEAQGAELYPMEIG